MSICCLFTKSLSSTWTHGTYWTKKQFLDEIGLEAICWIDRSIAEYDISYKQVIPYIVVTNSEGEYACYKRNGSEERLHDLWSCGIGGHIELCDKHPSLKDTVFSGAKREISEEFLGLDSTLYTLNLLGTIHEDDTEVGLHHIGIVLHLDFPHDAEVQPSDELHNFRWISKEKLQRYTLETWSCLALELHWGSVCHTH